MYMMQLCDNTDMSTTREEEQKIKTFPISAVLSRAATKQIFVVIVESVVVFSVNLWSVKCQRVKRAGLII